MTFLAPGGLFVEGPFKKSGAIISPIAGSGDALVLGVSPAALVGTEKLRVGGDALIDAVLRQGTAGTFPASGNVRISDASGTWTAVKRSGGADATFITIAASGANTFGTGSHAGFASNSLASHNTIPAQIINSSNIAFQSFYDSGGGADTYRISLGATPASWSGLGVFFLRDGNTVPSATPANGLFLYPTGGELRARSSGGLITTLSALGTGSPSNLKKWDILRATASPAGGAGISTVVSYTPPDPSEWIMLSYAHARDSTTDRGAFVRIAHVKTAAGACTLVGAVTSLHTSTNDAAWAFTIDTSGATVRLRATPDAANATTFDCMTFVLERA